MLRNRLLLPFLPFFIFSLGSQKRESSPAYAETASGRREGTEKWVSLFNGKNLDHWQPKIAGFKLGENYGNTFRVENGILSVRYDRYDGFEFRFQHETYCRNFHLV